MSTIQVSLPEEILTKVRELSAKTNEPIDELIAQAVQEHLRNRARFEELRQRGKTQGSKEKFLAALRAAPDVPPVPGDEIE